MNIMMEMVMFAIGMMKVNARVIIYMVYGIDVLNGMIQSQVVKKSIVYMIKIINSVENQDALNYKRTVVQCIIKIMKTKF